MSSLPEILYGAGVTLVLGAMTAAFVIDWMRAQSAEPQIAPREERA